MGPRSVALGGLIKPLTQGGPVWRIEHDTAAREHFAAIENRRQQPLLPRAAARVALGGLGDVRLPHLDGGQAVAIEWMVRAVGIIFSRATERAVNVPDERRGEQRPALHGGDHRLREQRLPQPAGKPAARLLTSSNHPVVQLRPAIRQLGAPGLDRLSGDIRDRPAASEAQAIPSPVKGST